MRTHRPLRAAQSLALAAVALTCTALALGAGHTRTTQAAEQLGADKVAVVGGVAANSELRAALADAALAPLSLCTDNAAMIASAARFAEALPYPEYLAVDAHA